MNETKAENYTNGFYLTVDALKLNGVTTIYGGAGFAHPEAHEND